MAVRFGHLRQPIRWPVWPIIHRPQMSLFDLASADVTVVDWRRYDTASPRISSGARTWFGHGWRIRLRTRRVRLRDCAKVPRAARGGTHHSAEFSDSHRRAFRH